MGVKRMANQALQIYGGLPCTKSFGIRIWVMMRPRRETAFSGQSFSLDSEAESYRKTGETPTLATKYG